MAKTTTRALALTCDLARRSKPDGRDALAARYTRAASAFWRAPRHFRNREVTDTLNCSRERMAAVGKFCSSMAISLQRRCARSAVPHIDAMRTITDSDELLGLLRAHMPSAILTGDDGVRRVARVDPSRPHKVLSTVAIVSRRKGSPAHELLERAYEANAQLDSDLARTLPIRHGPACSMWTLADAPYATEIYEALPVRCFEGLEGKPCPTCGALFQRDHRCALGTFGPDDIPF